MENTIFIGLNDNYHDPALCIVNSSGEILYCEATERLLQYKRAHGCPPDLDIIIEQILSNYINYKEQKIVIASSWSKKRHRVSKISHLLGIFNYDSESRIRKTLKRLGAHRSFHHGSTRAASSMGQSGAGVFYTFNKWDIDSYVTRQYYNHHCCHIVNAIHSSSENNGIGLVIDGGGEGTAISFYSITNNIPKLIKDIKSRFSLGTLYSLVTNVIGYSAQKGEEWKVMGLSPYGVKNDTFYNYLRSIFIFEKGKFKTKTKILGKYEEEMLEFVQKHDIPNEDIAFTGQLIFYEYLIQLVTLAKELVPNENTNLFISGGSALNSLAIGELSKTNLFKKIIVPNAPADDGNAIGAALMAYYKAYKTYPWVKNTSRSPYSGTKISDDQIQRYVKTCNLPFEKIESPGKRAAALLHENKIIGWIQGRAEFGPRSLGNRSILGNPSKQENKQRVNDLVKFREDFRPFAPSILHEFGNQYFEKYSYTPFMEKTLSFKENVKKMVPAVVHINGTGRLQSVTKENNPKYYNLIKEFHALSGIPIVMNTSYNVMGKPIVHDINHIMSVFFNSKLDAVFIGDYCLHRRDLL